MRLRWEFNQGTFPPGAQAYITFKLENHGPNFLWISDINIIFDFGTYTIPGIHKVAAPNRTTTLITKTLDLPADEVGTRIYSIEYHSYEWSNDAWVDLGVYHAPERFYLNIFPYPNYRVFLSRGLHQEDRAVGDPIAQWIRDWGFDTRTVGIEAQCSEDQVPHVVRDEILRADAFIAIATPRYLNALTGMWQTLEFLHGETGIAFGADKPMIILQEEGVVVTGLPGYLSSVGNTPTFSFKRNDLPNFQRVLQAAMPPLRDAVASHRWQATKALLGKLALGGGLLLAGGGIGAAISADRQRLKNEAPSPTDGPEHDKGIPSV